MKSTAVSIGVAIVGVTIASRAGAVERESHVGIDTGGAMLVMSDKTDVGLGLGGHWTYGLSDSLNLMGEAAWSQVAFGEKLESATTPRTRPAGVADAAFGVGYVLDVLRWVPYAGVLAGAYALAGGTLAALEVAPGGAIALGLDYRCGRSVAVGIAFREHFLLTKLSTYPSFTQVFARVEYTWGW